MRAGHFYTVQQDSINSPSLSTFHLITSLRQGDQLCRIEIMNGAGAGDGRGLRHGNSAAII
jgi:hypothetical protein